MSNAVHPIRSLLSHRCFALALVLVPLILTISPMIFAAYSSEWLNNISLGLVIAATIVASANFYLSFIRRSLYHRLQGSMDGYRNISGIPLLGSVLATFAILCSFGSLTMAILGVLIFLIDTTGPFWFFKAIWNSA